MRTEKIRETRKRGRRRKRRKVRKKGILVRDPRRTRRKTKRKSRTATLMSWKRRTQERRREETLRSRWVKVELVCCLSRSVIVSYCVSY